jgi:hypothetical protein
MLAIARIARIVGTVSTSQTPRLGLTGAGESTMQTSNVISAFSPSAHNIQRAGLGYSRPLENEELARIAPAIFAPDAHGSRSDRYAYIPTLDLINGMRSEGFMPVKVTQAKTRDDDKKGFGKHLIRFRRHDQLDASEAREVVILNSHDGSSGFRLMAGVYRLVCSNGLITGHTDNEIRIRHSGDAVGQVIEGACKIVKDFDLVAEAIDGMKSINLCEEDQLIFGKAALALRFDDYENSGIKPAQIIRPRRIEDQKTDLWTTFNAVQENIIRGGLRGFKVNANGHHARIKTREVKGIDQSVALNRGLWVLAEEMRKLAA